MTDVYVLSRACTRARDDAGTFRRARAHLVAVAPRALRAFLWIVNRRSSNFWQLEGLGLHDASDASFSAVHGGGQSHRGAPSGLPEHAPCRTHPTTRLPRRSLSERCVPHPRVSPFATPRHRHRPGRRRRRAWCADSPPTRDAAHALTHPTSPRASPRRAQGKEAVLATRTREVAARRTAGESAKRRRARSASRLAPRRQPRDRRRLRTTGRTTKWRTSTRTSYTPWRTGTWRSLRARHHRDAQREAQQEGGEARGDPRGARS